MIFLRPLYAYDIDRIYEIKSNPLNYNKEFTHFDTSIVTKEVIKSWYYNFRNEINTIRLGICLTTNNYLIGLITLGEIDYIKSTLTSLGSETHWYEVIDHLDDLIKEDDQLSQPKKKELIRSIIDRIIVDYDNNQKTHELSVTVE